MAWYKAIKNGDFETALVERTIAGYYINDAVDIGYGGLQRCPYLSVVSFPFALSIESRAFRNDHNLEYAVFPSATYIGEQAFEYCFKLKELFLPGSSICVLAASNAFNSTSISAGRIYVPSSLMSSYKVATNWAKFNARFSAIETYSNSNSAWYKITGVNFDGAVIDKDIIARTISGVYTNNDAHSVGACAFERCVNLTEVNMPNVTDVGSWAFQNCSSLVHIESHCLPMVKAIGLSAFQSCTSLTDVDFPSLEIIYNTAFWDDYNLVKASFPKLVSFSGNAIFNRCTKFSTLFLAGSSVCVLGNSQAFSGTAFTRASASAVIYAPSSLLTAYQTATNWTYFSSRFSAIEDYTS